MEIVVIIAAAVLVCATMLLKGKAWNSFVDDFASKDDNDEK